MMKIIADGYFDRVEDISHGYLAQRGICGIILDIDNTIVVDGKTEIPASVSQWVRNIGMPICLLSNGKEQRVKYFAGIFGVNSIHRAGKPSKKGYAKAAGLLGIEDLSKIAMIGDQLFSDILGGNISGCHTIKVKPIDAAADPIAVKTKRWFERFVR